MYRDWDDLSERNKIYMYSTQGIVCCIKYILWKVYFIDHLLIGIAINKELMTPYGQHGVYNAMFCSLKTVRDYRDRRKVSVKPYTSKKRFLVRIISINP